MAQEDLEIIYSGRAVENGSMDVRTLAPALLALAEVYQESQRVLYPNENRIALEVKATEHGSFEVHLVLSQSIIEQAQSLFTGDTTTSVVNIIGLIGGSYSLITFLRKIHLKLIRKTTELPDGMIKIELDDGSSFEIPKQVLTLSKSLAIRQSLQSFSESVNADGISTVSFRKNNEITVEINKDEVPAFSVPDIDDDLISQYTIRQAFAIASLTFVDGNKWRLSDGERTFYTTIEDKAFLENVSRDAISFSKHDYLECEMNVKQWNTEDGLKTEYVVQKVIKHIPASRPVQLPFEDNN